MVYYLLNCRSLTYAQRTAKVLDQGGISASIRRTPKQISGKGCGYSVKISSRNLATAISRLDSKNMNPQRIYLIDGYGGYREVSL